MAEQDLFGERQGPSKTPPDRLEVGSQPLVDVTDQLRGGLNGWFHPLDCSQKGLWRLVRNPTTGGRLAKGDSDGKGKAAMISLRNVSKSYPGHGRVVDRVSFEVEQGECLVLVGTSGCGKSTTLKGVNGLVRPDEGEVLIEGELLDYRRLPQLRRRIGYVIQESGLFPHLTVFDNVSLLARLSGWEGALIGRRVNELLEMVNLRPTLSGGKYPRELSGGEQQRVGVARALMLDPPILLMDEPFGALDPITRRQLQRDFLELQTHLKTKKTIVFVTHDMREALLMANRLAIMDQGRIIQMGTPEEIRGNQSNPFVRDLFLDL